MNSFTCPLCHSQRAFETFANFFRHVTTYHQSDPDFRIVCSLGPTCGALYRTFSAYKSHVYRHHQSQLHPIRPNARDIPSYDNDARQTETDDVIASHSTDDLLDRDSDISDTAECERVDENDSEWDQMADHLKLHGNQDGDKRTLRGFLKSFVLFILQLREDFFLPKHTMNTITNYIISLIERLQALLVTSAVECPLRDLSSTSTTRHTCGKMIAVEAVEGTTRDVCQQMQLITKNEYQFVRHCHDLFGYEPPVEITIADTSSNDDYETAYFIPIERTLSRLLSNDTIVSQLLRSIDREKRSAALDDDLMFSFRDGHFGARVDDDSLLLQLYLDDIGVTNPIGAKKDNHKMAMFYFSLEDIPDQYRSKLDFIQLLAVCESKALKVQPL
jgi:hypothetical protein